MLFYMWGSGSLASKVGGSGIAVYTQPARAERALRTIDEHAAKKVRLEYVQINQPALQVWLV